jgi:hypothetical protein
MSAAARTYALRGAAHEPQRAWVVRVEPSDGARFVLRDTPVLLRLSHAADPTSVTLAAVRVLDLEGAVPARVRSSADGRVVIWEPERLLVPGIVHWVRMEGLRDAQGREIEGLSSRFTPCGFSRADLSG